VAYYDALKTKWASAPAGTTQSKCDWINAQTVVGDPLPMTSVPATEIYNRTDRGEYNALQATKQTPIQRNLALEHIDFSPNGNARALWLATFPAGSKTQTNLKPYTDSFDAPLVPWATAPIAKGGGGLNGPVSLNDAAAAGLV
jgi:hypothetical protein